MRQLLELEKFSLTLIAPAGVHKGHTFVWLSVALKKYLWKKFENLGNFLFLHKVYIHTIIFTKMYNFQAYFRYFVKMCVICAIQMGMPVQLSKNHNCLKS